MNYGLSEKDYCFIKDALSVLISKGAIVWCFGSRARGDFHQHSDLDLMVESNVNVEDEIGRLKELFENSFLTIKVDLVDLSCFAKSYLENFEDEKKLF